jgi:prepilin-type N-terminal cleavage/methylation domain-containing protein
MFTSRKSLREGRRAGRGGFTLIELLIVVAIIALLASLLLVAVNHALRRAKVTQCTNNLRELGLHVTMYYNRYQRYPQSVGPAFLQALRREGRPPLIEDADKLFVCPLSGVEASPEAVTYRGPVEPVVEGRLKHSTPIACDRVENHGEDRSINVLYPNGRVELVYEESPRYPEALAKTIE